MIGLQNLLLCVFDGANTDRYTVEKTQRWNGSDYVVIVSFSDRVMFNKFTSLIDGKYPSDLEDDHNMFDLTPYLIDIGYSDMQIVFDNKIV